jgi:cellulose synthase/poly-beta-1,6-N-acetylglucosamine synthase-like glycosyltransferase
VLRCERNACTRCCCPIDADRWFSAHVYAQLIEDTHTSIEMFRRGWTSRYVNEPGENLSICTHQPNSISWRIKQVKCERGGYTALAFHIQTRDGATMLSHAAMKQSEKRSLVRIQRCILTERLPPPPPVPQVLRWHQGAVQLLFFKGIGFTCWGGSFPTVFHRVYAFDQATYYLQVGAKLQLQLQL